jgi:hypothetical protein
MEPYFHRSADSARHWGFGEGAEVLAAPHRPCDEFLVEGQVQPSDRSGTPAGYALVH